MSTVVIILHFIVTIGLIGVVLVQADKGSGLSGAFGGGASQTIFGSTGGLDFLGKLTTAFAILFMVTSLALCAVLPKNSTSIDPNIKQNAPMPNPASVPDNG
ncbi:MAG: preprotein translocase subunit SecG [Candidatus Wallbacteria bacterium]